MPRSCWPMFMRHPSQEMVAISVPDALFDQWLYDVFLLRLSALDHRVIVCSAFGLGGLAGRTLASGFPREDFSGKWRGARGPQGRPHRSPLKNSAGARGVSPAKPPSPAAEQTA